MSNPKACVHYIEKINESYSNTEVAYATRIRLQRLVENCSKMISEIDVDKFTNESDLQKLYRINDELRDMTTSVCQASEPFDRKWKTQWANIEIKLSKLKHELLKLESKSGR